MSKTTDLLSVISDTELKANNEKLLQFLNLHPKNEWIKKHPFAKNVDYLPVGKIEMLLDQIYGEWDYLIIHYGILGNSVTCHIRLTVVSPVTNHTITRDGIGAVPIELKATVYDKNDKNIIIEQGARHATDFEYLNRTAIMKNLPAAKSFALKDAADTLGNLFGRSLNRDKEDFVPIYSSEEEKDHLDKEVNEKISEFTNVSDLEKWFNGLADIAKNNEGLKAAVFARKSQLMKVDKK